jgi:hypothetical protein
LIKKITIALCDIVSKIFLYCGGNKMPTEVLTQDEIDQLLVAINASDEGSSLAYSSYGPFKTIDDFESFLTVRKHEPEIVYGKH